MNVLVIGGAGLIGSALVRYLINNGDKVFVLDDFCTGTPLNLEGVRPQFMYVSHHDVDTISIRFDHIYHLGSPTAPSHVKEFAMHTLLSNIELTDWILRYAQKHNSRMMFASSIRVFEGDENWNQLLTSPKASYIEGKRAGEVLCYQAKEAGTDVRVIRLFNVYGEQMLKNDSRVMPTFIRNAIRNEPLNVWGTGEQKESLMYVADAVRAIFDLMNIDTAFSKPYHLGHPEFISVKDLAHKVVEITNSKSTVVHTPAPLKVKYPDRSQMNVDGIFRDWSPLVSLEDGIYRVAMKWKEQIESLGV